MPKPLSGIQKNRQKSFKFGKNKNYSRTIDAPPPQVYVEPVPETPPTSDTITNTSESVPESNGSSQPHN